MAKFTDMEREAMERQRNGEQVAADVQKVPGSPTPVVSLKEFGGQPAAGPAPLEPAPPNPELPPSIQPAPVSSRAQDDAQIEDMKRAVFGDEQPADPAPDPVDKGGDILGPKICPRCGWDQDVDAAVQPTEADKVEFLESVLGERRFTKRIELLGGKMKATFRNVLIEEEDEITDFINSRIDSGKIRNEQDWQLWYTRCRLVVMLDKIDFGDKEKEFDPLSAFSPEESKPRLQVMLDTVPKKWPLAIHALLVQAMQEFDQVYGTLMSKAYDENFWSGQTADQVL